MILTKSLFVEYCSSPKLAWWHANDKKTYELIQEEMYGEMDGMAIGQSVEELVKQIYPDKEIHLVDSEKMYQNRHGTYHTRTMKVVSTATGIIYQPAFMVGDLFVKCDFLVPNEEGKYDLVEVKAKNRIRKEAVGGNGSVTNELMADVSIQAYVLRRALGEKFSGKCFIAYLNKEYVRHGEIDPRQMIIQEFVSNELREESKVEEILDDMRKSLALPQEEFHQVHCYDGSDYFTYYGKEPPARSIWSITRLGAEQKKKLMDIGKTDLESLSLEDIELLRNSKFEETPAYRFLQMRKKGEKVVNTEKIKEQLDGLVYPLYFYDYETVSGPIPIFDGTSPRQQIVVQYSLHVIRTPETPISQAEHFEWILDPWATSNESLVTHMLAHMDGCKEGTWIVRYKGFENYRNNELGKLYPHLAEQFQFINDHTFDLMEVFSNQHYFDRAFEWSASIKNVLPVLTNISYDGMMVPNGAVAAELLMRMITGKLLPADALQAKKHLLTYCEQDTWAMVSIREKLKAAIA